MKNLWLFMICFAFALNTFAQGETQDGPFKKPDATKATDTLNVTEKSKGLEQKKKFDFSNIIIEPNIQFSYSNSQINFGLAPYVGYRVWKNLYAGAGISYFYTGVRGTATTSVGVRNVTANFHTYGGGAFLQYNIWKGFFARAKFEVLHRQLDDIYNGEESPVGSGKVVFPKIERTYPTLFLGAGYNLLASKRFFMPILVQYNVLQTLGDPKYRPYQRGFVLQIGFVNVF